MLKGVGRGLADSSSIMLGYFPVAVSFGVAAVSANVEPWLAVLISAFIYAGASQFILLLLIAAQSDVLSMVFIVVLVNLRHIFYGPALLNQLILSSASTATATSVKSYSYAVMALGLTDEVFAAARAKIDQVTVDKEQWYFGLQLGAYSAWVLGTVVGAYVANDWLSSQPILQQSLGFVLPALFFALLLDMANADNRLLLVGVALATASSLWYFAAHSSLIIGMVVGSVWAVVSLIAKRGRS